MLEKRPSWLIDIQNTSYNPELLISGLSLFSLFKLDKVLEDLTVFMIQESTINPYLIFIATLYISVSITTLKYLFVFHLIMRGVWVGIVGITFVFPEGIKFEKLPKVSQQDFVKKEYSDPVESVITLEKICSSIFSIAFSAVGIILSILVFIVFATILNLFGISILYSAIITFTLLLLPSLAAPLNLFLTKNREKKEIPVLVFIYQVYMRFISIFYYKETLILFQSYANPYRSFIYFMILFMFLGFSAGTQLRETFLYFDNLKPGGLFGLPDRNKIISIESDFYISNLEADRIKTAALQDLFTDDMIEIDIAGYRMDRKSIEKLNLENNSMLYEIFIDSIRIDSLQWFKARSNYMRQKTWKSVYSTSHLPVGPHTLFINKICWDFLKEDTALYENWAVIPFYKK